MEEELEIDLRELFMAIWQYAVIIIAATVACTILSGVITKLFIPEKFEANATMIVNTRQDQSATVTNDQLNSAKQLVLTYSIILKSDDVMSKVLENLGPSLTEDYKELTAKELSKLVEIEQVETTQVMRITATTTDADFSEKIVSEIVKLAPNTIINTVKAGSVEVISSPKADYLKVSPSMLKNMAIGGFVGLFVSVAVVVLITLLDNTIKTDQDITKKLGLPVLGVIPSIK